MTFADNVFSLTKLVKRNLKLFLTDKAGVFFSLLAPLIVLMLFLLFLGDIQVETVKGVMDGFGVPYTEKAAGAFVNSWMFSGVMSVACITVSLGANTVMVGDRHSGVLHDFTAAPVRGWVVTAGYFIYNFIVTIAICFLLLLICFVYLAAAGQFYLTAAHVFALIGTLLFSALSATLFTVFISGFFRSHNAFAAFTGIVSAVVGFLIGAYMPLSMFPKAIQYFVLIVPGSYSAGLFRVFFMGDALAALTAGVPQASAPLAEAFTMDLDLFGKSIGAGGMCVALTIAVVLFAALNYMMTRLRKRG